MHFFDVLRKSDSSERRTNRLLFLSFQAFCNNNNINNNIDHPQHLRAPALLNLDSGLLCLVRTEKIQKSNLLIYSYLQWRAPTASGDGIINTADRWNAAKRTELIIICVAAELAAVSQRATATSNICVYISYHVGHSVRDWSVFFTFVQRQTRPTTFSVGNAIRNITYSWWCIIG